VRIMHTILLMIMSVSLFAQTENKTIAEGNNYYRRQQYDKAQSAYEQALRNAPNNKIAKFNLANTLIKQNNQPDAEKFLSELNVNENDPDIRSKAIYNQGVIFTQQKKLEQSIESYKATLRVNPNDKEARENLQKALLELKKKNPPKKQEEKKKKEEQKQQPKPKISPREAEQQLKLLEQKEKQVQERLQKNSRTGSSLPKDW